MAKIAVTGLFDQRDTAAKGRRDIEPLGVPRDDIGLLVNNADKRYPVEEDYSDAASGAVTGAGIGTVLGSGAGLLAGLAVMAIPEVGPVVAAGMNAVC